MGTRYIIVQAKYTRLIRALRAELPKGAPLPTRAYIGRGMSHTTPRLYSFEHRGAQWEVALTSEVAVIRVEE